MGAMQYPRPMTWMTSVPASRIMHLLTTPSGSFPRSVLKDA